MLQKKPVGDLRRQGRFQLPSVPGRPGPVAPRKSTPPSRQAAPLRAPKVARPVEETELPNDDSRELAASRRRLWTAIGAVGLVALIGVFVVRILRTQDDTPAPAKPGNETIAATTTNAPTPESQSQQPEKSIQQELAELGSFLEQHHADDPVACLERLRSIQPKVAGTMDERQIAGLIRTYEGKVANIGRAEYEQKIEAARRFEVDLKFGEALRTLEDLPKAQDPSGTWNAKLAEERGRLPLAARAEWTQIAAKADRLAREGSIEAALREAAQGEGFGIPEIEAEAKALALELPAIAAAAKSPAAEPATDEASARADASTPPDGTFDEVLASLADGDAASAEVECPLCHDLDRRAGRTCPNCHGTKQAPCVVCKGSGTWTCPAGVHKTGAAYAEEKDPAHVKKALSKCKCCNDKPERRCSNCGGRKTVSCKPCAGKGRVEWSCPLSKKSTVVPRTAAGAPCWLCKGTAPMPCVVCNGQGSIAGSSCVECAGLGKVSCATCCGTSKEPCGKCGGSGRIRTLTKAGSFFSGDTGTSGSDAGGRPDATSCDMCDSKGFRPCSACSRVGVTRCAACTGKEENRQTCWGCDGKKTLDACPACSAASLSWTRTRQGTSLFLCSLRDLEPLLDRGVHTVLGSHLDWMVLMIDNRSGKEPLSWTSDLGTLTLRIGGVAVPAPKEEVDRVSAFKEALRSDGLLFGIHPEALNGAKVEAGKCAAFLIPCPTAPRVDREVVIQAKDGSQVANLVPAALNADVRQALLARFWNADAMKR